MEEEGLNLRMKLRMKLTVVYSHRREDQTSAENISEELAKSSVLGNSFCLIWTSSDSITKQGSLFDKDNINHVI